MYSILKQGGLMFRKITLISIFLSILSLPTYATNTTVIDSPTIQIIEYGSYQVDFRVFRDGGMTPKLMFGVFNFLNLGISWEVLRLIGDYQAEPAVPALHIKAQIYSGNMAFPGVAIGYDGQGYIHKTDANDRYYQEPKGVYFLIGREVFYEGVIMNVGINSNTFKDGELYAFINMTIPLGSEGFLFMAEYDNMKYMPDARLNLGLRILLNEDVSVDLTVRDCWGAKSEYLNPNDRMLTLSYKGQF
jgi:hypothetical protein